MHEYFAYSSSKDFGGGGGGVNKNFRKFTDYGTIELPLGNSLYFYFGIIPGKSVLDKVRTKYFANCRVKKTSAFIIKAKVNDATTIGGSNGSIDITIIGGI